MCEWRPNECEELRKFEVLFFCGFQFLPCHYPLLTALQVEGTARERANVQNE